MPNPVNLHKHTSLMKAPYHENDGSPVSHDCKREMQLKGSKTKGGVVVLILLN